jgi:crossover junction endodeoxyribonuclease RuvC
LGIDPGSRVTGYGAVEKRRNDLVEIIRGEIRPAGQSSISSCLVAIEDIFYGKNVKSLIKQGQVRGVAILAAACCHIPVFEYTPLEIKQAVVGYGRAEKSQVQTMVKAVLHLSELPQADAADALAVAICHANFLKVLPI